MIDERTETQASLYALGALPLDESRSFEAAMRADVRLRSLVAELRAAADDLVASSPRVAPPAALKAKVMAAIHGRDKSLLAVIPGPEVDRSPAWVTLMPWALAACFAVLCVVLITTAKNLRQQAFALNDQLHERQAEAEDLYGRLDQLRAELGARTSNDAQRIVNIQTQAIVRINEISRQAAAITNQLFREQADLKRRLADAQADVTRYAQTNKALLAAIAGTGTTLAGNERYDSARVAILQPTPDGPPGTIGASVWIPQDQRGLIVLEKLPPLANPGQDYQLWLIDPASNLPVSAGVIPTDGSGSVRYQFHAVANVRTVDRFAVTVEPKGGTPRPTGKIVLASN